MLPVLLKPRILATKNRWKTNVGIRGPLGRDLVVLIFSTIIMFGIYNGTSTLLQAVGGLSSSAPFPPLLPLAIMLLFLTVLLFFSNGVAALSALYLSNDLDLILSSPISPAKLYFQKCLEVLLNSSWMAIVFGAPVILAFGHFYGAGLDFYFYAVLLLIPLFLIPLSCGVMAITLFSSLLSAQRAREIVFLIFATVLAGGYALFKTLQPANPYTSSELARMMQILHFLSLPESSLFPSHWAASSLAEFLVPDGRPVSSHLLLLITCTLSITSLCYITLRYLYPTAYLRARSQGGSLQMKSQRAGRAFSVLGWILSPQIRGIAAREFKLFARDMMQAVQLILLLGICFIYLYNFRALQALDNMPAPTMQWWKSLLMIVNLMMGAFVLTAVCTRFVFPTLSMEGQSFWIIQTSPISQHGYLRAKFLVWYAPIALFASVIFASGGLSVQAEPILILLSVIAGLLITHGLVSLAIGFGSYYLMLDWEHPSQVTSGFGSFLYMIACIGLTLINLIPFATAIFMTTLFHSGFEISLEKTSVAVVGSMIIMLYINTVVYRGSMRMAKHSLARQVG
jgi:ABC-2 type transport system permease protein